MKQPPPPPPAAGAGVLFGGAVMTASGGRKEPSVLKLALWVASPVVLTSSSTISAAPATLGTDTEPGKVPAKLDSEICCVAESFRKSTALIPEVPLTVIVMVASVNVEGSNL